MTRHHVFRALVPLGVCIGLAGCGHSPNFNVLGSYFPGWIACMIVGAVLAVLVHLLLRRLDVEYAVPWLPLFYFAIATMFACLFWLFFFD